MHQRNNDKKKKETGLLYYKRADTALPHILDVIAHGHASALPNRLPFRSGKGRKDVFLRRERIGKGEREKVILMLEDKSTGRVPHWAEN